MSTIMEKMKEIETLTENLKKEAEQPCPGSISYALQIIRSAPRCLNPECHNIVDELGYCDVACEAEHEATIPTNS